MTGKRQKLGKLTAANYTGQRFGCITVVSLRSKNTNGSRTWQCLCDCGKSIRLVGWELKTWPTTCQCKSMQRPYVDLTGQTFGSLTVRKATGNKTRWGCHIWECECECGNTIELSGVLMTMKRSPRKSCGCDSSLRRTGRPKKHGLFGTREYWLWCSAKQRAKQKGLPFNLEPGDIPKIPSHCPILGFELRHGITPGGMTFRSPTLDRIKPELGYVKGNVQIISQRANVIKNDATYEELQKVADYMRVLCQEKNLCLTRAC